MKSNKKAQKPFRPQLTDAELAEVFANVPPVEVYSRTVDFLPDQKDHRRFDELIELPEVQEFLGILNRGAQIEIV